MTVDDVGVVGSPSTTAKVTVDILEDASGAPLHGELVYLVHPLNERCLIAIGTVTEIKTSNRWHEDANMRGVLKKHGSLPHLSGTGDVRTAEVLVQAAYLADSPDPSMGSDPIESGGSLTMSPTTGATVARVTNDFLTQLLRRHKSEIIYLGHIYRTDVRLPLTLKHFGKAEEGGAGEAFHTGVFGMTGSGKSVFAAYLIASQLRHPQMGVFVMDPQGQFTSEEGIPFSLHEWAEELGREVRTYSVSTDLRLRKDAFLLGDLLGLTRFFKDLLTIKAEPNRESAVAEFTRALQQTRDWEKLPPRDVLTSVLTQLSNDAQALTRIYSSPDSRNRLAGALTAMLADLTQGLEAFSPLHSLFTEKNLEGNTRQALQSVIQEALGHGSGPRPFIIIDFSTPGGEESLLNSARVKARILRLVCSMLNRMAEDHYRKAQRLNLLVVFDEAQRFASSAPEDDESKELADRLVDYVRTTRKYGLGWMFITQEVGSLRRGIYDQLRVRGFGYGLTSGSELQRLRETIGDPAALELYRSFVDPEAISPASYPFMMTGPVSPLSFTGAPIFLSVYTDFDQFRNDNVFISATT